MTRAKRILIAASMNGGAEAVAPLVSHLRGRGAIVKVLSRDAARNNPGKAFESMGVQHESVRGLYFRFLNYLMCKYKIWRFEPDAIITGTQTQDVKNALSFEQMLWQAGKKAGVPTVAVLDNWSNEAERFSDLDIGARSPVLCVTRPLTRLPDKIAVIDGYQRDEMLRLGFEEELLVVTGNPFFEHVRGEFAKLSAETRAELLAKPVFSGFDPEGVIITFMSDEIEKGYPDIGFTEKSVLQSFLRVLDKLAEETGIKINVIVRPHPFRNENAADAFDYETPRLVKVLHNPVSARGGDPDNVYSMEELLKASAVVVGTFNNPLVTAAICRRPVVSYVPKIVRGHDFYKFLSDQGMASRVTREEDLAGVVQGILDRTIVHKRMDAAHGAIERVANLVL